MKLFFDAAARAEFIEAALWYNRQRPYLGNEFKAEVKQAIQAAQTNPEKFRKAFAEARKIRLKRFRKYAVYFSIEGDIFSVLAVFHESRNPDELKRQLG